MRIPQIDRIEDRDGPLASKASRYQRVLHSAQRPDDIH
jgi:hypothetical protein